MAKSNPLTKKPFGSAVVTGSASAKPIGITNPPKQKGNVTKARG